MPSKLKTMFETLDCILRALTFFIPALIYLISDSFCAFSHKDNETTLLYCLGCVIKSLRSLEKINILRKSTTRNYNCVSRVHGHLIHGIHTFSPFPMGLNKIASNCSNYFF